MGILRWLVALALLVSAAGCSSPHPVTVTSEVNKMPQVITWLHFPFEPNSDQDWLNAAKKRWTNPIIFSAHGAAGYKVEQFGNEIHYRKVWTCYPEGKGRVKIPVEYIAWTLHNAYPENDIILVVCNPDGEFDLNVPRVWYAKASVWATPDGYGPIRLHEETVDYGNAGTVWEFREGSSGIPKYPSTRPATRPTTAPTTKPATRPSTIPSTRPVGK